MSDNPDMLVPLLNGLPNRSKYPAAARGNATIRRVVEADRDALFGFIRAHFDAGWANAIDVSMARQPPAAYVAAVSSRLVGFAFYDAGNLGTFGPLGVDEEWRNRGIGAALLLRCLFAMRAHGYAYAVIRQVGPEDFYQKVCGATLILGS